MQVSRFILLTKRFVDLAIGVTVSQASKLPTDCTHPAGTFVQGVVQADRQLCTAIGLPPFQSSATRTTARVWWNQETYCSSPGSRGST